MWKGHSGDQKFPACFSDALKTCLTDKLETGEVLALVIKLHVFVIPPRIQHQRSSDLPLSSGLPRLLSLLRYFSPLSYFKKPFSSVSPLSCALYLQTTLSPPSLCGWKQALISSMCFFLFVRDIIISQGFRSRPDPSLEGPLSSNPL